MRDGLLFYRIRYKANRILNSQTLSCIVSTCCYTFAFLVGLLIILVFIFASPYVHRSCFTNYKNSEIRPTDICIVTWAKYNPACDLSDSNCEFWMVSLFSERNTFTNKENYARWHGYRFYRDFTVAASTLAPSHQTPCFSVVRKYLDVDEGCQWVVWVDADAFIMNPAKRIENLIKPTHDLLIGEMFFGQINAGVFLVKASNWSRNFFEELEKNNTDLWKDNSYEQTALNRYIFSNSGSQTHHSLRHIQLLRMCSLGSARSHTGSWFTPSDWWWKFWSNYEPGDFILHFWGNKTKTDVLKLREILRA